LTSLDIKEEAILSLISHYLINSGVIWMNWTFVGVLGTSTFCLAFLREKYHRTDVDIVITVEPPDNNK
jgi:hypothetical protein